MMLNSLIWKEKSAGSYLVSYKTHVALLYTNIYVHIQGEQIVRLFVQLFHWSTTGEKIAPLYLKRANNKQVL